MAIAVVATTNLGNNGGSTNNLTATVTISTQPNRVLLVCAFYNTVNPSSGSYNGVTMTTAVGPGGGAAFPYGGVINMYMLLNPPSGSHSVSLIASGTDYLDGIAIELSGVKQTGQPDNTVNASDTVTENTFSASITPVADNCWAIAYPFNQANATPTSTVAAPFTIQIPTGDNTSFIATTGPIHPAAAVTCTATIPVSFNQYQSQLIITLAPAIDATVAKPRLTRLRPKPRRRAPKVRRVLPFNPAAVQPARVLMKVPLFRHRLIWPRRKVQFKRPTGRHLTYPFPYVPPPPRYNQGIAFRQTLGYVGDAIHFDFGQFGGVANYPVITRQGYTVGFTTSYPTVVGQNQNAVQDSRIAGNLFNNF